MSQSLVIVLLIVSILIEVVGVTLGFSGLFVENREHAPTGLILITLGAVLIAIGSLIAAKAVALINYTIA